MPKVGAHGRRAHRFVRVALLACLGAVLSDVWCVTHEASGFVDPVPRGGSPHAVPALTSRRPALAGAAIALGLALAGSQPSANAAGAGVEWKADIPRALKAIKEYQQQWAELNREGLATAGANVVREGLVIKYIDKADILIPSGETLGVKVSKCQVFSVAKPKFGWQEQDRISAINGQPTGGSDSQLQRLLDGAKEDGQPIRVTVDREGPPLLDNFEGKLQKAYISLMDDSLPDLDEVQVNIGNTKVIAASAASATSPSPEVMARLKKELDTLVTQLTPIARAISG